MVLGFPSADHFLASISQSQWLEWKAFVEIDGPVGGSRADFHASFLAFYASRESHSKDTDLNDFKMPWIQDEPEVEDEEEEVSRG